MKRQLLAYAFPFMDSLDPIAPVTDSSTLDATLQMDEEAFRGFYTRTSGMVWAYLARATNDPAAADDLLQEAYYRLLRSTTTFESEDHRRNYLFRIATNLIRDRYRRPRPDNAQLPENGDGEIPASGDLAVETQQAPIFSVRWRNCRIANASWYGSRTARDRRTRRLRASWGCDPAASNRCSSGRGGNSPGF
jgi:RNA polymerase sigma factor (sigma-70 family)